MFFLTNHTQFALRSVQSLFSLVVSAAVGVRCDFHNAGFFLADEAAKTHKTTLAFPLLNS